MSSSEPLISTKDPWFTRSVAITAGAFFVAALVGFVVLPYLQPNLKVSGLWDAICSAAGVANRTTGAQPTQPTYKVSSVVLTSDMLSNPSEQSLGRGATLGLQCAICHGPTGVSRADSPNLAGQYASVVYKQVKDFKTGARVNAVMTPFAVNLSDQDMVDLAVYYAYLPRMPSYHPEQALPAPRIVVNGAPLRSIAPCGSCHGTLDNKTGSPWLEGQPPAYVKSQLEAFAKGERRNDISQQMRIIARRMTSEEIDQAARYYASRAPTEPLGTAR